MKTFKAAALKQALTGKEVKGGAFTVRSKRTGVDFTFKLTKSEFNGCAYIHVKTEVEYLRFAYLGTFKGDGLYRKGTRVEGKQAEAASWIVRQLLADKLEAIDENVELLHFGNCVKCGRPLTDATSIELGIGPHCRANH